MRATQTWDTLAIHLCKGMNYMEVNGSRKLKSFEIWYYYVLRQNLRFNIKLIKNSIKIHYFVGNLPSY